MTPTEFLKTVGMNHRTEYAYIGTNTISEVLVHGMIGVSTEAGELLDVAKKAMIYGKTPDLVNVKEELGDLLWYIGLMCIDLNCTFEELFDMNWEKLKLRYEKGKFSEDSALNRNLAAERVALETQDLTAIHYRNTGSYPIDGSTLYLMDKNKSYRFFNSNWNEVHDG
jgi:NTP pyrophosphatase (non-canonical NTP hydrolase)